ncbi:hypothetical protein TEA_001742 [Camellia sinensis var. sinensis]|uniref:PITH domain-containing protein n=1 Tax=Camellia sinensis var. sinensis TaxID=542762 RepID=A0A4S4E788_CAMSN|nr:hypothetical protein TEA_001742 [Camellia sinensis var. sinensis]
MESLALMKRMMDCLMESSLVMGRPLGPVTFISTSDSESESMQKTCIKQRGSSRGRLVRANLKFLPSFLLLQKNVKVSALNEAVPGSVKSVFKAWEQRLNISEGHLESNEGDPELLVFIPFTSDVKIKSISVVGGADGTSPSKMRAFINREGIDFSDAQNMQSIQEWDLVENLQGVLEYQTKYSRFQGVGNLTLHFPENFGGDATQIHYIGLKGEATQLKRDVVATIVYELMPNPSDHKTKAEGGGGLSHVE